MSLRTPRGAALVASLLIVAAACTPAASPGAQSPGASAPGATGAVSPSASANPEDQLFAFKYEPKEGKPGGSVVIGEWQPPSNYNPYYSNAFATVEVLYSTHKTLWTVSNDGHWKPDLASKMPKFSDNSVREPTTFTGTPATCGKPAAAASPSAAGSAAASGSPAASESAAASPAGAGFDVDIELRPGLKWSDGQPLTLNDLKYTWQWNCDPDQTGLVTGTTGWEEIAGMDVQPDGLKATIHFKSKYAGFYGLLSSVILPEHYMKTIPVKDANKKSMPASAAMANVPSSGPFKWVTASPQGAELEKNPNWVGGTFKQGAYLDKVKYTFYSTVDGMKSAFLAGDLDVALNMAQADYDSIKGVQPDIGKALTNPAWEYEHLDINQGPAKKAGTGSGHELLMDVNGRKAIQAAIDRKQLFQTLFPGAPLPEKLGCAPAPPGLYFRDESVTCPDADVAQAKQLLTTAGWTDSNNNGTVDKGGKEAVLESCTTAGRPVRELTLRKVSDQLKAIGVKVNVNFADATSVVFAGYNDVTDTTKCSIYRGTYDIALYTSIFTFDLFGDYYYSYHSTQNPDLPPNDGGNTSRFNDPEMDKALDTMKNSIRTDELVEAAHTAQKLDVEKVGDIGLYYRESVRGVSTRLQNFFTNPSSASDMWNIEDWWVEEGS
jgi:peptide/nickel transport system substrate-binding protein